MDRWSGILKVPLCPNSRRFYKIAASLCLSSASGTLAVPSANVIFFNGDRVQGTGNPIIEKLSNLGKIAEILVLKFGRSINAWVIEAADFNGPFAVYKDFIPTFNRIGDPNCYNATGFPASLSTTSLLLNCFNEARRAISERDPTKTPNSEVTESILQQPPKTFILGFSKGGAVINQLITELSLAEVGPTGNPNENWIIPVNKESLLNSIVEIHYVDVGLNCPGAYVTDGDTIRRITDQLVRGGARRIRFVLHGTPRQWSDRCRVLIGQEKDEMVRLLEMEACRSGGKLQVCERFYFADRPPSLEMHFEVIESMDVS